MSDTLYHYCINLRTEQSPTKKLQKAFNEESIYLDKDLKPTTYGRHLMFPSASQAEQLIEKILHLLKKRYGDSTWATYAYGTANRDKNTLEKFESHKKLVEELLAKDFPAEEEIKPAEEGEAESVVTEDHPSENNQEESKDPHG